MLDWSAETVTIVLAPAPKEPLALARVNHPALDEADQPIEPVPTFVTVKVWLGGFGPPEAAAKCIAPGGFTESLGARPPYSKAPMSTVPSKIRALPLMSVQPLWTMLLSPAFRAGEPAVKRKSPAAASAKAGSTFLSPVLGLVRV